ncbi:hypothetical protein WA026_020384, partial [Henosepilachna vigintioctopunctata]
ITQHRDISMRGNSDKQKKIFKIMHLNIQGISNKAEALDNLINSLSIDVVCLSEHWLNVQNANLYHLSNRQKVACFARENYQHGGVCIYINENLEYT